MRYVYVLYGKCIFSGGSRRNRVVNQWAKAATRGGFVVSDKVPGYGPGMVSIEYIATPEDAPDLTPGNTYQGVSFAFEHSDPAIVDFARDIMLEEIQTSDWLHGEVGSGQYIATRTPPIRGSAEPGGGGKKDK